MTGLQQIPRNALVAVLIAAAVVVVPHVPYLPVWITVVCLCTALWRAALLTGRGRFPPAWLRATLVIGGTILLIATSATLYALEPLVSLLVFAFSLKLIEMRTRRDLLVVVFIAYAVAGSYFLFGQSILSALYCVFSVSCVTAALVALHQSDSEVGLRHAYDKALRLLLQAAPLMLILFLTFPRFDPLWGVPDTGGHAKTGPSEQMSPGDIAQLAKSDEPAFRVSFNGVKPPVSQRYWRGMVLSDFDGRTWTIGDTALVAADWPSTQSTQSDNDSKRTRYDYSVLIEPSRQPFLYALPGSSSLTPGVLHRSASILSVDKPLLRRFFYEVTSQPDVTRQPELSPRERTRALRLPEQGNERSRTYARSLRARFPDDGVLVQNVLSMFTQQPFVYTLKAGRLGENPVDEFLFETRRGFCEHFASSFTFLMREAGIPARIVAGYQGGEFNPFDDYLLVRQYDAHAWTEVWLPGTGWQRVDPTAAVAPHRIESGARDLWNEQQNESQSLLSPGVWRNLAGLRWLRQRLDTVNYAWAKWVVNYTSSRQANVLKHWLGEINVLRMFLFVVGGGALVMLLVGVSLLLRQPRIKADRLDKLYLGHCTSVARLGLTREKGEGAVSFARRIADHYPILADEAHAVANEYCRQRYAGEATIENHSPSAQDLSTAIQHFDNSRRSLDSESSGTLLPRPAQG